MRNLVSPLRFLPLFFVLLFAAAVGIIFRQHDARPLSNEALNCAQIARNVTQGHGFSTDVLQNGDNSTILSKPIVGNAPDLLHAPLYPALLAIAFSVFGETDGVVSGFSLAFFVLSAVLLFVLARRLLNQSALPLVIAAAYAVSLSVLGAANSGQPQALSACLLLLLLLSVTAKSSAEDEAETEAETEVMAANALPEGDGFFPPPRRFSRLDFVTGLLAATCYLNDYLSIFAVVPLLILWRRREDRARGAFLAFALGFFVLVLPWWIRNVRLTGNPFSSQEWLLLAGQAGTVAQWLQGMPNRISSYATNAATWPHLLLAPFILVSLWLRPQNELLARRALAVLGATLLFIVALSAFGRSDSSDFLTLAPLLCLVGFVSLRRILSQAWHDRLGRHIVRSLVFEPSPTDPTYYDAIPSKAMRSWRWQTLRLRLGSALRLPIWLRKTESEETLYAGRYRLQSVFEARSAWLLTAVLALPYLWRVVNSPRAKLPDTRAALAPLTKVVAKNRLIVTDAPQAVAWYIGRRALMLPPDAIAVASPESVNVGALFLSGQPLDARLQGWQALYNGIEIPGYQRASTSRNNALYLKQPSLEEARRAVKSKGKNVGALSELGQLLLAKNEAPEALAAFLSAQKLQPKRAELRAGAGFAYLQMKDFAAARSQFAGALQLSPRSQTSLLGLAQVEQGSGQSARAIALYERVLADDPENKVALNNLANLFADGNGNLFRALEMARRVAQRNPNNASIIDTLGWTCWRLGYRDEALRTLKQAAKLDPKNANIRAHLKRAQG